MRGIISAVARWQAYVRARASVIVSLVAETVQSVLITDSGHFVPEERPDDIVRHVLAAVAHTKTQA